MVENAGNFDVREWSIAESAAVSNAEARTCLASTPQPSISLLLEIGIERIERLL